VRAQRLFMAVKNISVEVVYAEAKKQALIRLLVPFGSTVLDAINTSAILTQFPHLAEVGMLANRVGIFGKIAALETVLKANDRIEIYRDLITDPKENRRLKAVLSKRQKAQAFDAKKRQKKLERQAKRKNA
jgi:putative ubiquitin-RnfH superfamily antitoxin RatB of RatAB toxin-antitoxin module